MADDNIKNLLEGIISKLNAANANYTSGSRIDKDNLKLLQEVSNTVMRVAKAIADGQKLSEEQNKYLSELSRQIKRSADQEKKLGIKDTRFSGGNNTREFFLDFKRNFKSLLEPVEEVVEEIKEVTKTLTAVKQELIKEYEKEISSLHSNTRKAISNRVTNDNISSEKLKSYIMEAIAKQVAKAQSGSGTPTSKKDSSLETMTTTKALRMQNNTNNKELTSPVANETNPEVKQSAEVINPDNEVVVKTNKEREKALQNLEDYNKIFANIGSEEITLRQRILENTELYAGHLSDLVEANGKLVDAVNAQVFYGRQFATVLAKAVRGVGRINLPRSLGNLDIAANQLTEKLKQTKVQPRVKQAPEDSEYGSGKQALEEEVRLKSGKPRGSFKDQENKNQRRQEQKSFIALLIPALAKLLKKSPIWDAIKLLLLKFGKNHPLLTAGALMAGPALMAGGIGLRAMGGLKGIGGVLNRNSSKAASNVLQIGDRKARVRIGRLLQAPGNYLNGLGSRAESNVSNKILDLQNNRRALLDLQASKEARIPQLAAKEAKLAKQQQYAVRELLPLISGKNLSYKQRARKVQLQQEVQKRYGKIKNVRAEIAGVQSNAAKLDPYLDSNLKAIDDLTRAQKRLKNPMWNLAEKLKVFGSDIGSVGKGFIKSIGSFAGKVKNIKLGELLKGGFGAIKGGFLKSINPMTAFRAVGKIGKGAKVLGPIGTALTAVAEIPDLINAARSGKPGALKKQLVKSGGGVGGALVGGAIGSALGPVGTVVGAIIGDIVGRIVGPALFDGFKVFTGKLGADFKGIWDGLKQTFGSAMRIITPIARLIGRMLVPSFKLLGLVLGGLVKAIVWTVKIVAKTLGWVADKIANVVESITKGLEWLGNKLLEIPVIGPALRKLYGTSGDEDNNTNGNTAGNAANTAAGTGGGSSAPAKQGNTNFDKLVQEERGKMKKEGIDKNLKDPDKAATLNAIQRLNKHTTNGIANTVDMRDLGLYGNVAASNSRPYIPVNNALRMKMLDNKFKEWGVVVDYTSNMGGHDSNKKGGHYVGNKVDVVTKDKYGRVRQLSKEQENWLRANGYIGNGAVGWHDAGSGYHYDLRVAPGARTNGAGASTATGTATSTAVHQQTDDGVREALLAFTAANKKDKEGKRTRDLIFQATDVTGSLGCWGITQVNNSGQMRH